MKKEVKATARVLVTLEVSVGPWGADCTVQQILDQASREASASVSNMCQQHKGGNIRLVGKAETTVVLAQEGS